MSKQSREKSIRQIVDEELAKVNIKTSKKYGTTLKFADGVAVVSGLEGALIGQKLRFPQSWERARQVEGPNEPEIFGLLEDIDEYQVKCLVFGEERFIKQGDEVEVSSDMLTVPVTPKLLGHVVDPFCRPLSKKMDPDKKPDREDWFRWVEVEDDREEVEEKRKELQLMDGVLELPIERKAVGIIDREPICEPLQTGIRGIDSMLPIGKGQRMLMIGDRATGKTTLALDMIINQNSINNELNGQNSNYDSHHKDTVYCVYVAIGKKASEINHIYTLLKNKGAMQYTTIIAAMANDPAPLLYVAPFAGSTVGEFFRDTGRHALVIYDDLTKHANAYRQISLLLNRPPGREAYPGDVFYLHSRLLERASKTKRAGKDGFKLSDYSAQYQEIVDPYEDEEFANIPEYKLDGGGSLTAIPMVETKQGDYSAYIPTNIISITDGQVFLSEKLMHEGVMPAINVGISVSRVGSQAQTPGMKAVSKRLREEMAIYREKEKYLKFGSTPTPEDQKILDRGRRMVLLFNQRPYSPVDTKRQVITLYAIRAGFFDVIPIRQDMMTEFEELVWKTKILKQLNDFIKEDFTLKAENLPKIMAAYDEAHTEFWNKKDKNLIKVLTIFGEIFSKSFKAEGKKPGEDLMHKQIHKRNVYLQYEKDFIIGNLDITKMTDEDWKKYIIEVLKPKND